LAEINSLNLPNLMQTIMLFLIIGRRSTSFTKLLKRFKIENAPFTEWDFAATKNTGKNDYLGKFSGY
jgi:hypothetical protein